MATRVYHMHGTATAATNGVAYVDITRNCVLRKIAWTGVPQSAGANDMCRWELTINTSTTQYATNNPNGFVSEIVTGGALATSGAYPTVNFLDAGMAHVLKQGDRIYLHCGAKTGSGTATATANLTVDE